MCFQLRAFILTFFTPWNSFLPAISVAYSITSFNTFVQILVPHSYLKIIIDNS